jgi:hypothetical protein
MLIGWSVMFNLCWNQPLPIAKNGDVNVNGCFVDGKGCGKYILQSAIAEAELQARLDVDNK